MTYIKIMLKKSVPIRSQKLSHNGPPKYLNRQPKVYVTNLSKRPRSVSFKLYKS